MKAITLPFYKGMSSDAMVGEAASLILRGVSERTRAFLAHVGFPAHLGIRAHRSIRLGAAATACCSACDDIVVVIPPEAFGLIGGITRERSGLRFGIETPNGVVEFD